MFDQMTALRRIDERGPRFAVYGEIRRGQARTEYADIAERAEEIADSFRSEWGYHGIIVHPPTGSIDLAKLGRARADAKRAFDEATNVLRAGVLRAAEEKRAEAEIAREAGIDRMTVRSWLGK